MDAPASRPRPALATTPVRIALLGLLVTVAGNTGCSFLLVDPPPRAQTVEPGEYPDCVSSQSIPSVDGVIAGLALIVGLTTLGQDDESGFGKAIGIPALVVAGPYAVSSVVGFRRTARCRRLKDAETRRRIADEQWRLKRDAPAGAENGMCLSDGDGWRCNAGLSCVRYRCVKAAPAKPKPKAPVPPKPLPTAGGTAPPPP